MSHFSHYKQLYTHRFRTNKFSENDKQQSEAFGNAFLSALIENADSHHNISAQERLERAKVLRAIILFSLRMGDSDICGGLDTRTFAETLAHILVEGAAGPARSAIQKKQGDTP